MKGLKIFLFIDYIVVSALFFLAYHMEVENKGIYAGLDPRVFISAFLFLFALGLSCVYVLGIIRYWILRKNFGKLELTLIISSLGSILLHFIGYYYETRPSWLYSENNPRSYMVVYLVGIAVVLC